MDNSKSWNADSSNLLKNIYRCADKSSWYSQVAVAYDRTRPRYPTAIMNKMQKLANLQLHTKILEIGSGPGIASVELAKLGIQMVCIEPSLAACEIARRKCAAYSNVEFINTTFEEWTLEKQKFDAVIATTSFHWVTPEIRNEKTAAALKENGVLILLWNTPPQPNYQIFQSLKNIYLTYAPDLAQYEEHQAYQQNLAQIGQEVINSGYFKDLISEQLISKVVYSIDDYLTLLSTLSPYIRLTTVERNTLFTQLKQRLENTSNNQLELSYLSMLQVASKNNM